MTTPAPDNTPARPEDAARRAPRGRHLVTVFAALVVGVGGTLAVERTLLSPNATDDVADICGGTVVSTDVGPVTRNIPSNPSVTSSWVDYARDGSLLENCTVSAGNTQALRVTANLERGSTADWERFTRSQIPGAAGPENGLRCWRPRCVLREGRRHTCAVYLAPESTQERRRQSHYDVRCRGSTCLRGCRRGKRQTSPGPRLPCLPGR